MLPALFSSPSPPIFFLLLPSCRQVWLAVSPCSLLARVLATVTLFQLRPRYYSFARRGILQNSHNLFFFFATPDPFKYSFVTPPPSVRPRGRTSRSQHQYSPIPPLNRSSAESLEIFLWNPFFLRGSINPSHPPSSRTIRRTVSAICLHVGAPLLYSMLRLRKEKRFGRMVCCFHYSLPSATVE